MRGNVFFAFIAWLSSAALVPPVLVTTHVDGSAPLIGHATQGAEDIKYGFEGGSAWLSFWSECPGYFLSMTEMFGDPHWIATRLGLWSSPDGLYWTRTSTLGQGSGNTNGTDWRSHLDAPMLVFNTTTGHFEMFYVAYWHGVPGCSITSCNGSIWRSQARLPGCAGLAGPYDDVGPILLWAPPDAQPWEGNQGDDSISTPFPAPSNNSGWLAAYGSSRVSGSSRVWAAGMVSAPSLAGPWVRAPTPAVNPISDVIGGSVENPLIYVLPSTLAPPWRYIMVYDGLSPIEELAQAGYSFSIDGMTWTVAQYINMTSLTAPKPWFTTVRTPQGLVPTGRHDGEWFMYFTAGNGTSIDGFPYYAVARATVELQVS